jgi:hypothetical protein
MIPRAVGFNSVYAGQAHQTWAISCQPRIGIDALLTYWFPAAFGYEDKVVIFVRE